MEKTDRSEWNKLEKVISYLDSLKDPGRLTVLSRFGIPVDRAFGIPNPVIQKLAGRIGRNQELSLQLWDTGYHEALLLSSLTGDPKQVTESQMDRWVTQISSWAAGDGLCGNLFWKTPFAYSKALEWSKREPEYEKRAGFALMAMLAVHDKKSDDANLLPFFSRMEEEAWDSRNFVKKGINWALRQCGKRSLFLHERALVTAYRIGSQTYPSARWIASDAIRELKKPEVWQRMVKRESKKKKISRQA